ncbi:MAG: tRNA epoxyqueuosine(34) reductase QueG [Halieaceae bacterium]|nr:tRNA epoxyqueuosine(34) reductase QueG [Halieaceae bacterium]
MTDLNLQSLNEQLKTWSTELGFNAMGISDIDLKEHPRYLQRWLDKGYHGSMNFMAAHGEKRWRPEQLEPGTLRVISVRMDYLPDNDDAPAVLEDTNKAYIARYTLGRDYHKLVRKRLATLAKRLQEAAGGHHRAFVDSAPVLERAIAEQAGLGWIGKNTMLINDKAGSWFFLGEIYTDLPLPVSPPKTEKHCGSCSACLDICPTDAFAGPFELDARKCISYLTIEHKDSIDVELRSKIGNRIFGCDDCQLFCPWNKFAKPTLETDFKPRHGLDNAGLVELFLWDEQTYLARTEGSALRRIGYERWLRNIAVALGNAPSTIPVIEALKSRLSFPSDLVQEHVVWALEQHNVND